MPSATEISIRVGSDADIPRVIELMRASLGEGKIPRTRRFFDWKHGLNPFGRSPMWVAESADALVGVRIFMPWSWAWGEGRAASAVRAVDTATHPDFQGKGIFKKLTLALVDQVTKAGVGLIFNTPNDKSRPGYLKMGWTNAGKAPLWLRPEGSPRGLLRLLRLGAPEPAAEELEVSDAAAAARLRSGLADAGSTGLLAACETEGDRTRYRTPKSADYLCWRYADCPAADYQIASDDAGAAFAIYRVRERRGLRELSISELMFRRSPAGLRAATKALALARRAARADYALVAFERDPLQALALSAAGFLPVPSAGPIFTTRPLNTAQGAPDPQTVRSFRASIGDLELF